ncbi:MAG: SRPBCC domain-containing protein [Chloroflexota bacterium]
MHTETLEFSQTIRAEPSQVYYAFTNALVLTEWLCDDARLNPKAGAPLYLYWNNGYYSVGEFIELTPNEKVVFSWRGKGEPDVTQVHVRVEKKDEITQLTLKHSGLSNDKWKKSREAIQRGWERGLKNLKSVLETGDDSRFVDRPMLGITISEFINDEIAAEKGYPVKEGFRIDGVVEGLGAQAAGLQQDDIITQLARKKTTDWPSLLNTLDDFRAGDQVEVAFYRGSEKKTVTMELSRRPLPTVPPTAEGLANKLKKAVSDLDKEMQKVLEVISEQEASHHPKEGEWNVKEILAHLIASERDTHNWIGTLLEGEIGFVYSSNVNARVKAVVATLPTVSRLFAELQRSEEETLALISALPETFVKERKGSYKYLGYRLLDGDYHYRTHINQIKETVEAARKK